MDKDEVVKKIESILNYLWTETGYTHAIYRTPVQQLRYQADEIENKEKTIREFFDWFNKFRVEKP